MSAKSSDAESPWWMRRAALAVVFVAATLVVVLVYSASTAPIVAWRLITDGSLLMLWLLGAFGLGWIVLRGLSVTLAPRALHSSVSIALGLGLISLLILAMGLIGCLNRWSAFSLVCAPAIVGIIARIRACNQSSQERDGWRWLILLLAPLLAISVIGALVPPGLLWGDEPNGYDVVEYHLQVPREWYEAGRIIPLSHNVFSYFPMNVEMHYLLAMHLRGGPWGGMYLAQLMHVAFSGLAIFAIYALLADRGAIAIIACVFAGVIPWMSLLAPIAYTEGGLLLWATLAIGLLLKKGDITHFVIAGAMGGLACGAKLTAVPMILVAVPIALALARPQVAEVRKTLARSALFVGAGLLTLSPWLIRDFAWTRNPVFPEATSVFGKAHWSDVQIERWQRANHLPAAKLQSLSGRAAEAWNQVLADRRFAYVVIVVALVCAILARRSPQARYLIILLLLQSSFWLFFTHLQSRFFVMSIPIAALLLEMLGIRGQIAPLAAGCAVLGITTCIMMSARLDRFAQPGILGAEDLMQLTPLVDTKLPDDAQVVLVGDAKAFIYQIPMSRLRYRTVFDVDAKAGQSSVDAWRAGAAAGANMITVIDPGELERFSRTYWMIPPPPKDVAAHARPYVER